MRSNDGFRDLRGAQVGKRMAKWVRPRVLEPSGSSQAGSETTRARFTTGFSDGLRSWLGGVPVLVPLLRQTA
jgi:hypothetical protein